MSSERVTTTTDLTCAYAQTPRFLIDGEYSDLSLEAKFTYTLIYNRARLSQRNGWANEGGEVYIIYSRQELSAGVGVSEKKIKSAMDELKERGLIVERRRGQGNANLIFITAEPFNSERAPQQKTQPKPAEVLILKPTARATPPTRADNFQNRQNCGSRTAETDIQEPPISPPELEDFSNKYKYNKSDLTDRPPTPPDTPTALMPVYELDDPTLERAAESYDPFAVKVFTGYDHAHSDHGQPETLISVTNKGKTRIIFVSGKLRTLLLLYAKANNITKGAIFVTRRGKPIDRRKVWEDMKALAKMCGVDTRKAFPHNVRRLFAREMYAKLDNDIAKLADFLGHATVDTTRIYLTETDEAHRKAIEGLNVGGLLDALITKVSRERKPYRRRRLT